MKRINTLYKIGMLGLRCYYKIWHRLKALGVENMPEKEGFILACNHISHLDPPAIGTACHRQLRYVAKDELFHQFFLKWYLPAIGVIPIKRGGGGKYMLDKAAEAVRDGDAVIFFPEGTRSRTGIPGRPRTGMIVLAAMAEVPVVPCRISGSYDCMPPGSKFARPGRIQVAFGKPIRWEPGELDMNKRVQMTEEANKVFAAILDLPGWFPRSAKVPVDKEITGKTTATSDSG